MPTPLQEDPRIDPRLKVGEQDQPAGDPEPVFTTREELLAHRQKTMGQMLKAMAEEARKVPPPPAELRALWSKQGLDVKTRSFTSQPDGNTVQLMIARPENAKGVPLVYWTHGGGMAMMSAFDPGEKVNARIMAREGVAVAAVDFRNSEVPTASNRDIAPYPGGLNDCYSGLLWCHAHAAELGVDPSRIIVAGPSGGGNLCIAVALKAKQDGKLNIISGVYSLCPYIAGTWPSDVTHEGILGDSHVRNGALMQLTGTRDMSNHAMGYSAAAFRARDPLAWPGFATVDDLKGMPRFVVSVNECDPLRDEGVNFYRRLLKAGVRARCRDVIGTTHGGDLNVVAAPDLALGTLYDITSFAKQVGSGYAKL